MVALLLLRDSTEDGGAHLLRGGYPTPRELVRRLLKPQRLLLWHCLFFPLGWYRLLRQTRLLPCGRSHKHDRGGGAPGGRDPPRTAAFTVLLLCVSPVLVTHYLPGVVLFFPYLLCVSAVVAAVAFVVLVVWYTAVYNVERWARAAQAAHARRQHHAAAPPSLSGRAGGLAAPLVLPSPGENRGAGEAADFGGADRDTDQLDLPFSRFLYRAVMLLTHSLLWLLTTQMAVKLMCLAYADPKRVLGTGEGYFGAIFDELASRSTACYVAKSVASVGGGLTAVIELL